MRSTARGYPVDDHGARNTFRPGDPTGGLPPRTAELVDRRSGVLGSAYRLFYREPVHLVRGSGAHVFDADGNDYLDVYNNVASVGHAHPRVVAAIAEQAAALNTHTRYVHERIVDYSEALLATMPDEIDRVMYLCTGSEANDLAVRVARAHTGGTGVIVSAEAYHGNTELTSALSPALGSAQDLALDVRTVPAPDPYRAPVAARGPGPLVRRPGRPPGGRPGAARRADGRASSPTRSSRPTVCSPTRRAPPGSSRPPSRWCARAGGVFIADEVQPGFGRTGDAMWGFARHGVVPELVTLGKPMAAGIPVSAVAARADVLASFGDHIPYFNTYGGNPVSMAAAQAVLDVLAGGQAPGARRRRRRADAHRPARGCRRPPARGRCARRGALRRRRPGGRP